MLAFFVGLAVIVGLILLPIPFGVLAFRLFDKDKAWYPAGVMDYWICGMSTLWVLGVVLVLLMLAQPFGAWILTFIH